MSILSGRVEFFGLDIGSTEIRLVQLSGKGPHKTLVRYAYLPIQSNISRSDLATDREKLASMITTLVSKSGVTTKNVAVGLFSQKVFTTIFEVDKTSKEELEKSIKYQIDSIIPTPIEFSKIDWTIIGDSPKNAGKLEILLSSVANQTLEDLMSMLEGIGLNVIAFEPDIFAVTRSLSSYDDKSSYVILDFGSSSTDFNLISNGIPYLARSINIGSQVISKSIMDNLNVSIDQANQFLFKFGLDQNKMDGNLFKSMQFTLNSLVNEISKSLKYHTSKYPDKIPDRIIITGGLTNVPGLANFIAQQLKINVEIGNPWRNILFNKNKTNELMTIANKFGVAAGLAERET